MHTYIGLVRGFVLVHGVFCQEGFVQGCFCPSPLLSEYIRYNIKLNITFNFRFYIYENLFKSVMSHALVPSPVTNFHTFSDPLPPSVTYFMDGPLYMYELYVSIDCILCNLQFLLCVYILVLLVCVCISYILLHVECLLCC